jgi:hypothetical protein
LRPLAQGWPRHEAYPGTTSQPSPNRIAVVASLDRQFPHRPVLPILLSCPLSASWINPPLLFNHEVHQRHETHSHAETPSPPRLEYPSSRISMTDDLKPDTGTVGAQTPLSHTADEAGFPSAFSASLRETTSCPQSPAHHQNACFRSGSSGG